MTNGSIRDRPAPTGGELSDRRTQSFGGSKPDTFRQDVLQPIDSFIDDSWSLAGPRMSSSFRQPSAQGAFDQGTDIGDDFRPHRSPH